MYFLLKMVIFHWYLSLLEGKYKFLFALQGMHTFTSGPAGKSKHQDMQDMIQGIVGCTPTNVPLLEIPM